jgi:hypothetical protein
MSVRNGDKARFGRLRKQKIRLRNRIRKMRDDSGSKSERVSNLRQPQAQAAV